MKVTGCKKIYNAENIIEAEMLVEMLKENGIAAFTQEPSSSVAAYVELPGLEYTALISGQRQMKQKKQCRL